MQALSAGLQEPALGEDPPDSRQVDGEQVVEQIAQGSEHGAGLLSLAFLRSGGSGTGSVIRGDQAKNAFSRSSSTLKKFPVPSSLYSETRVDSMRCLLLSMGWGQKSASARLIEDTNRRCQKLQTGCWNFFPQRKKAAAPTVDAAACSVSSGKMAQRFTLKAAMPG